MLVIDELTRKPIRQEEAYQVVVNQDEGVINYGFVKDPSQCVSVLFYDRSGRCRSELAIWETTKDDLFYSNLRGTYIFKVNMDPQTILSETYTRGQGSFPYNTIQQRYEAVESFKLFKNKPVCVCPKEIPVSKYLQYTFGLEFETSEGYVPENICYRDGLIPLHDGSITGIEYSTIVLEGESGLNFLRQQLETLRKYTMFDKECSLHIHFGGFPLDKDAIFRLYYLCYNLQGNGDFVNMLPQYTFQTSRYKASGKDYCKPLPRFRSFNEMYRSLVGEQFYGSFEQPHPNDIERRRKWQIPTRYYWVNFINALCYKVNKTIEFRLLRPSFNYRKICVWLLLMNAILKYAQGNKDLGAMEVSLSRVLHRVYPEDLANMLDSEMLKLRLFRDSQNRRHDQIGSDLTMEDVIFPPFEELV